MDIRNFFGKPSSSKKKVTKKSNSNRSTGTNKTKSKTTTSSNLTTTTTTTTTTNTTNKKSANKKKERIVIKSDSGSETTIDDDNGNNAVPIANKKQSSASTSTRTSTSTNADRKSNGSTNANNVKSVQNDTNDKKRKQIKMDDDNDDDSTTEDESSTKIFAKKKKDDDNRGKIIKNRKKKQNNYFDDDGDEEGDDDDDDDDYNIKDDKEDDDDDDDDSFDAPPAKKSRSKKKPVKKEPSTLKDDDGNDDSFEVKKSRAEKKPVKKEPSTLNDDDDSNEDSFDAPLAKRSRAKKKPVKKEPSTLNDDEDDDSFATPLEKKSSPKEKSVKKEPVSPKQSSPTSKKRKKASPSSSKPKKAPSPKKVKKEKVLVKPECSLSDEYKHENARNKQLFDGITFVITGQLENKSRDEMIEYIRIFGGRNTTNVSSKTNYLIAGDELEDGRPVEEGSKYKAAVRLGESSIRILDGEGEVFALAKMLDDKGDVGNENVNISSSANGSNVKKEVVNPYAKQASSIANPYAKNSRTVNNPYAKVQNPYASRSSSSSSVENPYASRSSSSSSTERKPASIGGGRASLDDPSALWADKYAPGSADMILGNAENVRKLRSWLNSWESTFVNQLPQGKKRSFNPKMGPFKAALLSGPPGIGKTTTAVLVAKEAGRQVLELNASDTRSKKSLETTLGDVTGSHVLSFGRDSKSKSSKSGSSKKRCIIMDEVDGMGAGDRSGMSELIKMIKNSMVPIICICNDRQSQKLKSLVSHCLDLRYRRPPKTTIAKRVREIGTYEGMSIEPNAAEAMVESCGNDIRQVLNCLQMWSNKKEESHDNKTEITYKDYKDRTNLINKDEILRVSLFDATKMLVEGRKGISSGNPTAERNHLYERTDAYFVDYSLMGLMVHQNYPKVVNQRFLKTKASQNLQGEFECLKGLYEATQCMSDFTMAEDLVRSQQSWGLLPLCSVLATKTGYHAGGESGGILSQFPEFSGWLGKNSSRGKKTRLLQELSHHMNYKVSADNTELRLGYLPAIRNYLAKKLITKEVAKVEEAIEFMDMYGLDRDDVFENLDEFTMDKKLKKFGDVDSKVKAKFTREYNKGIHKSQALVDEQGVSTRKRKAVVTNNDNLDGEYGEYGENDDNNVKSESESETEMDVDELKKLFKSSKKTAAKGKGKSKTSNKKAKK